MAQVMVAAGAGGLACWLSAALFVRRRDRPGSPGAGRRRPATPAGKRIALRPAVTASGQRIWIDPTS